jgi:hypothetical protein
MATSWDPADKNASITLSTTHYANDTAANSSAGGSWIGVRSTNSPAKTNGKWHFECKVQSYHGGGGWSVGIANSSESLSTIAGGGTNGVSVNVRGDRVQLEFNGVLTTYLFTSAQGDVIAIEVDLTNSLLWFQDVTAGTGWSDGSGGFTGNPGTGTRGFSFSGVTTVGGVMIIFNAFNVLGTPDIGVLNPGPGTSGVAFAAAVSSGFSAWDGGAAVIVDAPNPVGSLASQAAVKATRIESLTASRKDIASPCEAIMFAQYIRGIRAEWLAICGFDGWLPVGLLATANGGTRTRLESAAVLSSPVDLISELGGGIVRETATPIEWLIQALFSDRHGETEYLASLPGEVLAPAELIALVLCDAPQRAEWLGATVAPLVADALLPIQWPALPATVRVSLERLLASPGRRRALATPGRLRLLKWM